MRTLFQPERRLGYRILRWVLITAFTVGLMIGSIQIFIDFRTVSHELDERAQQTLALVREAATQAVYSIDEDLAEQVIDGLFEQQSIRGGEIVHPDGMPLARADRSLTDSPYRSLTDAIFGQQRTYRVDLVRTQGDEKVKYGQLIIEVDTAPQATLWLERASLILLSGIARALILGLVLYVVYHLLVTRPLFRIAEDLSNVDPADPGQHLLQTPKGHDRDELDTWVKATNELLTAISETQQKHQDAQDRITRLSRYDSLTGLPNRDMFLSLLNGALENARRQRGMVAIFCLGLDDFKTLNEQYGFSSGDQLLQVIAERITNNSQDNLVNGGRLGADQFAVIQGGIRETYQAAAMAEWLLHELSRPVTVSGKEISITATIGVAIYPDDALQSDRLLQKAEQSMTLAKSEGRNRFQFYVASVDQAIRERKHLERDLDMALAQRQFHLVYQPQVDMDTHRVLGAEALLRWQHPERGFIPPDEFIPLAELNLSIIEIGYWVLDEACRQAREWMDQGLALRMSVNLSPVQLRQNNIVDVILGVLRQHDLPPSRLELEVTETSFMQNLDDAIGKLSRLRDEGIRVAVDDFGTGYSSLTYLKRLPVHHLKIDKQFIRDLLANEEDTQIANTIIDLGRSLSLDVIAEGVETEEQSVYLVNRGCVMAQGYYFSKPVDVEQFQAFIDTFETRP
ncbi:MULTISPECIES: putative bifunctional diguanylate cyclase/phosphodiesterase [Halomonadaceae]|uniref:cyclic-guanylate-specific phosphodiesterase n=1 Tax=Vreelandella halophila TaxID=86177 RepID=A0A9X4YAP8_9GAMM|nr:MULTISPECIES: GGDEF domain-containing phosphodiesterase [Halomonas]MYL25598.1 EAL domain-containing protein [Halomonas utahensis]MYL74834.1 EAL domain-containing protein [Halomonas sp. 22501_18_FS]